MTFTQLPNIALASRQVMMVPSHSSLPVTQIHVIRDTVFTLRGGEEIKSADDIVSSFKEELQKIRSELEREAAMEMCAAKEELQVLEEKKNRLEIEKQREEVQELVEEATLSEEGHVQEGESMDIKSNADHEEKTDNAKQPMDYNKQYDNVESRSEIESEPGNATIFEETHVESPQFDSELDHAMAVKGDNEQRNDCQTEVENVTVVEEEEDVDSNEGSKNSSTLPSNEEVATNNGENINVTGEALEKEEVTSHDRNESQGIDSDDEVFSVEISKDEYVYHIDSIQEKRKDKLKQKTVRKSHKKLNRPKKKKRSKASKKKVDSVYMDTAENDKQSSDVQVLVQKSVEKDSPLITIAKGMVPTIFVIVGLLIMNFILELILKKI